jgi:hypothetical protein
MLFRNELNILYNTLLKLLKPQDLFVHFNHFLVT